MRNPPAPTRSPLKKRPLRNPGESLQDQIYELAYEKLMLWLLVAFFAVFMAALEWWRAYFPVPPNPWASTIVALLIVPLSLWKARKVHAELNPLKLGRDGEKAVGQALESLRPKGLHVLHDIPCDRGNIDHAIIAPSGIYAVETKTYSKPVGRDAKIRFDGTKLEIDGFDHSEILAQVKAQRDDLRRILRDLTNKEYPVRGVLVFPGWYVDPVGDWRKSGLWVFPPDRLPAFLDHEPPTLTPSDVALATESLATYIRNKLART